MALANSIVWRGAGRGNPGSAFNMVRSTIGTYATGGLALSANSCGLNTIAAVNVSGCSTGGFVGSYDSATGKLMVFQGDNTNAAAAPLIEVPNATDLSAVVITILAFGS